MFNFLSQWKLYILSFALIGTLLLNVLQRFQYLNLVDDNTMCQGKLAVQQVAINVANEIRVEQERKLRLREQEAALARAESQTRMDKIMKTEINGGCEDAILWMIERAN